MTKKGKKKKQQTQEAAASTSTAGTSEQTSQQQQQQKQQEKKELEKGPAHQQQASSQQPQQKKQTQTSQQTRGPPQQQPQVQQQIPQQQPQPQAWGPRQQQPQVQQQVPQPQPQARGPRQQQPQIRQQVPPQQAWGPRQQQPQLQQQIPVQQQQVPAQQAQGPRKQQPQIQQVPPQQAWGPRQPQPQIRQQTPAQQQHAPSQQAWGPRQQQPQMQQQARSQQQPQMQQVPAQQAQGPRKQQPQVQQVPPQQAWGPRQPQPQIRQQTPVQQQQVPSQQAWGPRQQQPQVQQQVAPQQAWGPRQQQPQVQQQVAPQQAWGPRQQQPRPSPQTLQQQPLPQQAWGQQQSAPQGGTSSGVVSGQSQQAQTMKQVQDTSGAIKDSDTRPTSAASSSTSQLPTTFSQLTMGETQKPSEMSKKPKSQLKECQLTIPQRANPMKAGTQGKPIRVLTNMFEIKFQPNFVTNAVHYDIDITPIASKSIYRRVFEECRRSHFSNRFPAFDGKKNAYSANNLPFNDYMTADIQIFDDERGRERDFNISFNKVADVDLSWIKNLRPGIDEANRDQTGIQVLDIIMRHAPSSRLLPLGKSFFSPQSTSKPLGNGATLYIGPFSSAVLGWKPYLNIDVAHKGFATSQAVIALMSELCGTNQIEPETINQNEYKISKYLTGLKIDYCVPNQPNSKRTYRINGIGPSAREERFEFDGSMDTIEEFFRRKKNYKLKWPTLPCLWVGSQTKEQKTYLPVELCKIVDGQPIKRLDERQTATMIRFAATDTFVRRNKISEAFSMINVNNSQTMRDEFHLSVDGNMKEVEARILTPPVIQYCQTTAMVNRGTWRAGKFSQAMQLQNNSWTILNLNRYLLERDLREFVTVLRKHANNVGMHIGDPLTPFQTMQSPERDIREISNYFHEKKNLKLIIVVLPDRTDRAYSKVKQITELKVGVLTQCIKTKTITEKCNEQTVKNILLKINSKLNGINHTFTNTGMPFCLRNANCMLVGADVSHPPPDAKNIPSIAAVAASHDETAFQYNVEVKLQEPKTEMIADFEEIIFKQIVTYCNKTRKVPTRIIFYRDGVSEGQLAQVMYWEINAIKRAIVRFARSKPTFKPEITCLVVQKRHHVRIFPTRKEDSDDRNCNVKAGTIVDKEITHPNHIDFYLVSHASVQGTAKPTKYRCICNESDFTEDQIEELTYYLCHIYARCTRSVSYPAPTYYAHLAAYRGRAWIQEVPINVNNLAEEQRKKLDVKMLSAPMCFV